MTIGNIRASRPKVQDKLYKGSTRRDAHKRFPPEQLYTVLSELDFTWYHDEVERVIRWWRNGTALGEMSEKLNRDPDEVAILLMDLARAKRIKERQGGVYGGDSGSTTRRTAETQDQGQKSAG